MNLEKPKCTEDRESLKMSKSDWLEYVGEYEEKLRMVIKNTQDLMPKSQFEALSELAEILSDIPNYVDER